MNRILARRYATAIYDLAAEKDAVERVGSDLERIAASIEGDEQTRRFFLAPIVDRYQKERVLAKVFEGRVEDIALHALLLLVRKHRESLLRGVIEEYRALATAGRGVEPLLVMASRAIAKSALAEIVERIERVYGRRFEARLKILPGLIGGLRVVIGDRRIDGTIDGRLQELSRTL